MPVLVTVTNPDGTTVRIETAVTPRMQLQLGLKFVGAVADSLAPRRFPRMRR
jgi:hypothetical protein